MFGLVNLFKPTGITSRKAINQVQQLVRPAKIGHAGTLDPLAQGVLVVTIGPATRLTNRIQAWPKIYRGTFQLGKTSDTEDIEGQVTNLPHETKPTRTDLDRAVVDLTGEILQRPPAYSALKVKGKRAYQLAREGITVELEPRPITIYELAIERYEYPEVDLHVVCSSGTYVRSLGRDLARAVGSDAVMSALTRTAVGHLTVTTATHLEELNQKTIANYLLSPVEAVRDLPSVQLDEAQMRQLAHGGEIHCPNQHAAELAGITPAGGLAAVLAVRRPQIYGPQRNFVAAG